MNPKIARAMQRGFLGLKSSQKEAISSLRNVREVHLREFSSLANNDSNDSSLLHKDSKNLNDLFLLAENVLEKGCAEFAWTVHKETTGTCTKLPKSIGHSNSKDSPINEQIPNSAGAQALAVALSVATKGEIPLRASHLLTLSSDELARIVTIVSYARQKASVDFFISILDSVDVQSDFWSTSRCFHLAAAGAFERTLDAGDYSVFRNACVALLKCLSTKQSSLLVDTLYALIRKYQLKGLYRFKEILDPTFLAQECLFLLDNEFQDGIITDHEQVDTAILLLAECTEYRNAQLAEMTSITSLFDQALLHGYSPSIQVYNRMMHSTLSRPLSIQAAQQMVGRWLRNAEVQGIKWDKDTFAALFNMHGLSGSRLMQLINLDTTMQKCGVKLDLKLASARILAYAKCGHWEDVMQHLADMPLHDLECTIDLYNAVLFEASRDVGASLHCVRDLFHTIRRTSTPNMDTYNAILRCCLKCKDLVSSIYLVREMPRLDKDSLGLLNELRELGDETFKKGVDDLIDAKMGKEMHTLAKR